MTDNTRMKEIQGEQKRISETLDLHHDRFMQIDQRFKVYNITDDLKT